MQVKEYNKKKLNSKPAPEVEEMVKKLRKEHSRLVKGMFEFVDAQGGWVEFSYRFFKEDPIQTIPLVHGEICELPMGIIKHLNNTVKKVRNMATEKGDGSFIPASVTKTSRLRFTPMDVL